MASDNQQTSKRRLDENDYKSLEHAPVSPPPIKRKSRLNLVPSPFHLTTVRDLPASHNVDAVSLRSLIGDALITQAWFFDFLFDIDFLVNHLDPDTRHTVDVRVVHGSWKREDSNLKRIDEACKRHPNVTTIKAYLPDPFGCHHSKMMILFRNDDTVQVVIHTANMIPLDWTNMTQAVWQSPRLPILPATSASEHFTGGDAAIGSGIRFKQDLLAYLDAYGNRLELLTKKLQNYDCNSIHAALVASVPSKVFKDPAPPQDISAWGWPKLKSVLSHIPCAADEDALPRVVAQVSSIATLPEKWIRQFMRNLGTCAGGRDPVEWRIMFPTTKEVQNSLDGYEAGGAIHMRTQSPKQQQQLAFLQPSLVRWSYCETLPNHASDGLAAEPPFLAGRARAAPHIKTYMRFTTEKMDTIDWAMISSANLSMQAWGELEKDDGAVRICSYEIGVVVWPALYGQDAKMVPTFMQDMPRVQPTDAAGNGRIVGIRMPYDLPLTPYAHDESPWCATAQHPEPDSHGRTQ